MQVAVGGAVTRRGFDAKNGAGLIKGNGPSAHPTKPQNTTLQYHTVTTSRTLDQNPAILSLALVHPAVLRHPPLKAEDESETQLVGNMPTSAEAFESATLWQLDNYMHVEPLLLVTTRDLNACTFMHQVS